MAEELRLFTIGELIEKLKKFDLDLPVVAWDWSDMCECLMPLDVDFIYEDEIEERDFDKNLIFKGKAVILNTMRIWPYDEKDKTH